LRPRTREKAGRDRSPRTAYGDSQSVKAGGSGGATGYDAGKKITGRKRDRLLVPLDELDHGKGNGQEYVAVAVEVGHLDRPPRRLLYPRPNASAEDETLVHLHPFRLGLACALKVADVLDSKAKGVEHDCFSPGIQPLNISSILFSSLGLTRPENAVPVTQRACRSWGAVRTTKAQVVKWLGIREFRRPERSSGRFSKRVVLLSLNRYGRHQNEDRRRAEVILRKLTNKTPDARVNRDAAAGRAQLEKRK
jgi:hypothetical protein